MRTNIVCKKCGKLLAKIDDDGAVHIRAGKRLPQIIASGRVLIICPAEILRQFEAPILCGVMTEINGKEIYTHVSNGQTIPT